MTPNPMNDALDSLGLRRAYDHNGDRELLESLGLKTTDFESTWTDLGIVTVEEPEADEAERGKAPSTVKVEVSALPAQFWRFTITRPVYELDPDVTKPGRYDGTEEFEITTGSGGFGDYWPVAEKFAKNMLGLKIGDRELRGC